MVAFGFWSRRTARDIIPLDGISRLIFEQIGVQQRRRRRAPQMD